MAEENRSPETEENEFAKVLQHIGADLWSGTPALAGMPDMKKKPKQTARSASGSTPTAKRKPTGIDTLWKTADETVDWTDALSHEAPSDGLTPQRIWSFYHRMAEKVLQGDIEAYAEVLTTANPLGDLAEYTDGIRLRVPDADRVEAIFETPETVLDQDQRFFLSSLSLRIARDLLACLPVCEVGVTARRGGETLLEVTYPRDKLRKLNFAFLDPIQLTGECGGWKE